MAEATSEVYQLALNKSAGGILIINDQLHIEFINDWLQQALGLPSLSAGQDLLEKIPQAANSRFLDVVKAALARGVASRLSSTFTPNLLGLTDPLSGESLVHSSNISALQSENKHYCLVNIVDESKPVKREKLLSDYIQKIKDTETELQKSRDMAIQASQVKTEFIASVSHQLRTPLNAIVGFSELLADGALGELNAEQYDSVKDIVDAGKLLSDFVTQMLFISDYSANSDSELEPVSLAAELQNLIAELEQSQPYKQLNIQLQSLTGIEVKVNRRVLRALLKNLVTVAAHCQQENLHVSSTNDMNGNLTLCFNGDGLHTKLTLDADTGRVQQLAEQSLNTQGDMRFYLELSHQLAELAGIQFSYHQSQGLRLIFNTSETS